MPMRQYALNYFHIELDEIFVAPKYKILYSIDYECSPEHTSEL
jgi:hypothetical protein